MEYKIKIFRSTNLIHFHPFEKDIEISEERSKNKSFIFDIYPKYVVEYKIKIFHSINLIHFHPFEKDTEISEGRSK